MNRKEAFYSNSLCQFLMSGSADYGSEEESLYFGQRESKGFGFLSPANWGPRGDPVIPQRLPCGQSGGKCFVAVLEQEQTGVNVPCVRNLEAVFQAFVMMAGNSLIWTKEGAKKEHVLRMSLY